MNRISLKARRMAATLFTDFAPCVQPFSKAAEGEPNPTPNSNPAPNPTPTPPPPNNDYVNNALFQQVIADRDKAKAAAAETTKQLQELQKSFDAMKSIIGDDPAAFTQQLNDLKAFKETAENANKTELEKLQSQISKLENEHKLASEKSANEWQKERESLTTSINELTKKLGLMQAYKRDNELYRAASEAGAANPDQVVMMLSGVFQLGEDGEYYITTTTPKGAEEKKSIKDYTTEFLADEKNANLLKTGMAPRTSPGTAPAPGTSKSAAKSGDTSTGGKQGSDVGSSKETSFLQKLGRQITNAERARFRASDFTDEQIAQALYYEQKMRESHKAKWDEINAGKALLPGERAY